MQKSVIMQSRQIEEVDNQPPQTNSFLSIEPMDLGKST